jgi:two-component system, OmpR family, response regulator
MQEPEARILCVDTDAETCEMVRTMLGNAGYEVAVARTVAEGLRRAKNDPCDLILLDWYFEDGSGLELCQMIRTFNKVVSVLFHTGEADERAVKSAVNAGAQGYLIKPCPADKLRRAIGLLLSQRRAAEPKAQSKTVVQSPPEQVKDSNRRAYRIESQARSFGIND